MRTFLKIFITVAMVTMVFGKVSKLRSLNTYNLDLSTFEFFKYPGKLTPYGVKYGNPNPSLPQKAKAVYRYFRNVILGHPLHKVNFCVEFDERKIHRLRAAYQRQFGYRGENLVALIGNGHSPQELRYYGAIGRDFRY